MTAQRDFASLEMTAYNDVASLPETIPAIDEKKATMIEASVNWTDKDRFVGSVTSRQSILMDAATERTANSPMELVILGLCGSTAEDVIGALRKKGEKFTGLEVRAEAERARGHPAVYTSIHLRYLVRGHVSRKAMEDAVQLSHEKYCSVTAMLAKTATITYSIEHVS